MIVPPFQADLTRAAIAVTYLDIAFFYLRTEFTQSIGIQFRMRKTTVACETAATHFLGYEYLRRT